MSAPWYQGRYADWPLSWHDAANRFQQAWRSGERPAIEAYLAQVAGGGPKKVFWAELLAIELEERRRLGETPALDEYRRRFPGDGAAVEVAFCDNLLSRFNRDYRYRVTRILGQGAFGRVYLGWDNQLARPLAFKVSRFASEDATQRFLSEARTMAALEAPGIVPVHDFGRLEDGSCFLAMRYMDGGSLADLLAKQPLTLEEAVRFIIAISKAVELIHGKRIIHRDLKPANILFDADNQPHVGDFGLALYAAEQRPQAGVAGTWAYIAPEMVRGEANLADGKADIWSLGVILYELLTGARPFQGSAWEDLREAVLLGEPKPPSHITDTIPPELDAICLKCLDKDAKRRFQSAGDVAAALERWWTAHREVTSDFQTGVEGILRHQLAEIRRVSQIAGDGRDLDEQFIDVALVRGEDAWVSSRQQQDRPATCRSRNEACEVKDLAAIPRGVILGDPAAGKTTLLMHLVAKHCRTQLQRLAAREISHETVEPACFCRAIDLGRTLSKGDRPALADVIVDALLPSAGCLSETLQRLRRWLLDAIQQGRLLLMIDGLDEVPEAGEVRCRLLEGLKEFDSHLQKARLWLSSRWSGYPGPVLAIARRNHFAIKPFDDERMERFVRRWLPDGAGAFVEGMRRQRDVWELLRTPLMLRLACQFAERAREQGEQLPRWTRRADLFRGFINHLIDRLLDKQGQEPRQGWRSFFNTFASRVALWLQEHFPGENLFSEATVFEAVAASNQVLPEEAPSYTREDLTRVGLMVFVGVEGAGVPIAWFHRTVQEYLAGVALAHRGIDACCEAVVEHCYKPEWQEVLSFVGGVLVERELPEFVREFVRLEEQDSFDRPMEVAVRAVAASRDSSVLRSLRNNLRDMAVIKYILRDPWDNEVDVTPWIRAWGAEAWEPLRDWVMKTRDFRDSDRANHFRCTAVRAIAGLGIPDANTFLLHLIDDEDEHWEIRTEAIEALARRRASGILPRLVAFVSDFAHAYLAISSVRYFEPPAGAPRVQLRQGLRFWATNGGYDGGLRAEAVRSLGWLHEPADRRLINRLLTDPDSPDDLRTACVETMVRWEGRDRLTSFFGSKKPEVRAAAAHAAVILQAYDASDRLCSLLLDNDAEVRRAAANTVSILEIAEAVPPLRQLLEDDPACEQAVVVALARLTIGGLADARSEVTERLLRWLTESVPGDFLRLLCRLEVDEVIPWVVQTIRSCGVAGRDIGDTYIVTIALEDAPMPFLLRHEARLRGALEARIRNDELYTEARERLGKVLRRYLTYHREPWAGPTRRSWIQRVLLRTTWDGLCKPECVSFRNILERHLRFLAENER